MAAHNPIFDGGGSGEGIFTRVGKCGVLLDAVNLFQRTTLPDAVDGVHSLFVLGQQAVVGGVYDAEAAAVSSVASILATDRQVATAAVQTAYQATQGPDSNFLNALTWVVGQMALSADSIKGSTPTAAVAAVAGNTGQSTVVASIKRPDGRVQENAFGEVVTGMVMADSQAQGVLAGNETWAFRGTMLTSDPLSPTYPTGSGCSVQVTAVDPTLQQGSGGTKSWLNNGDFGTWTVPNIPDRWTVGVGTPGTTILRSATSLDGAYSLEFVGNGTEDTAVLQTLNSSSGTLIAPGPLQQLVANLFYLRTGAVTAGSLELALVDGSGVVLNDAQGVPNAVTVSVVGSSMANWAPLSAVFRTPRSMPSTVSLRVRTSVAMAAGNTLLVDRVGLALPNLLYTGGPSVAVFSNPAFRVIQGDAYTVTVANAYAGRMQWLCDRLFGMKGRDLLFPSVTDGSETIPDSLIA